MFTLSLLVAAQDFKTGMDLSPVLIFDLLPTVKETLLSQGYSQTPDIAYTQGNLRVPFLIDTEQIVIEQPKLDIEPENLIIESRNKATFLKVLAIGLILIAVIKIFND